MAAFRWRPSFFVVCRILAFIVTFTERFQVVPLKGLMNPFIRFVSELQEVSLLIWRAFVSLFSKPR